jgi:hypothetical protein
LCPCQGPERVTTHVQYLEPISLEAGRDVSYRAGGNLTPLFVDRHDIPGITPPADGGQRRVSDVVRDLGDALGLVFVDAGPRILQGFQAPSQVFELKRAHAG